MVRDIIHWNSMGGQLLDAFNREMEGLADRLQDPESWNDPAPTFAPRTDVLETDKSFEIDIELPGMKADDFEIEFHEGKLSVSGERVKRVAEEGQTLRRIERQHGKFRRVFSLGTDVDTNNVSANYENGILTVVVPKTPEVMPKKIKVKVS